MGLRIPPPRTSQIAKWPCLMATTTAAASLSSGEHGEHGGRPSGAQFCIPPCSPCPPWFIDLSVTVSDPLRIQFDAGTLILSSASDALLRQLPGCRFDERTAAFRTEAQAVLAGPVGELPDDVFAQPPQGRRRVIDSARAP